MQHIHQWPSCQTVISSQAQSFHQINPQAVLSSAWVLQHICKVKLSNTVCSLNQSLSRPFIHMQMWHIYQCWVVKHCSFIKSILSEPFIHMCNTAHLSKLSCQTQFFHQISFKTWWRCCLYCNILQPQLFHWINS